MLTIQELDHKDFELCYELDLDTICLWTKKQWQSEFNKTGVKVVAVLFKKKIIGIYVVQTIIDEVQINYFSIKKKFRRKGYGSYLMTYLVKDCQKLNIKKLVLEVSGNNSIADVFYRKFDFITVGRRKNYYRNGADAILKEKKIEK